MLKSRRLEVNQIAVGRLALGAHAKPQTKQYRGTWAVHQLKRRKLRVRHYMNNTRGNWTITGEQKRTRKFTSKYAGHKDGEIKSRPKHRE